MQTRLRWCAAALAVFWAVAMILWSEPKGWAPGIIFSLGGVFVGLFWYMAMQRFFAWHAARQAKG